MKPCCPGGEHSCRGGRGGPGPKSKGGGGSLGPFGPVSLVTKPKTKRGGGGGRQTLRRPQYVHGCAAVVNGGSHEVKLPTVLCEVLYGCEPVIGHIRFQLGWNGAELQSYGDGCSQGVIMRVQADKMIKKYKKEARELQRANDQVRQQFQQLKLKQQQAGTGEQGPASRGTADPMDEG